MLYQLCISYLIIKYIMMCASSFEMNLTENLKISIFIDNGI